MMKKLILLLFVLNVTFPLAQAGPGGSEGGGGGDPTEIRINEIRDDISKWIIEGNASGLEFPYGITLAEYESKMLHFLDYNHTTVLVTSLISEVLVDGEEKTCKGYFEKQNAFIVCHKEKFESVSASLQYKLIHHEFAGLAYLERNNGSRSDYFISKQVTGYLRAETVLRLSVKSIVSDNVSTNYKSVEYNDDGSISINGPMFKNPTTSGDSYISSNSDLDGVCKLYGMNGYYKNSVKKTPVEKTVKIGNNGEFVRFFKAWHTEAIKSISCINADRSKIVSTNYSAKVLNDDGSITIGLPRFRIAGEDHLIAKSYITSGTGVCKLFGYNEYIRNSMRRKIESNTPAVHINRDGEFLRYVQGPVLKRYFSIKSIICK